MNDTFHTDLGQLGCQIKEFRLSKGMTQSVLASCCDIDVRTIQMIEKGSLNMSLKIFFAIAHSLEIRPSILLASIEQESPRLDVAKS